MGELASAYWASFAKTGDPNGANRPHRPSHDPAVDKVIDFTNNGVVVGPDPLKKRSTCGGRYGAKIDNGLAGSSPLGPQSQFMSPTSGQGGFAIPTGLILSILGFVPTGPLPGRNYRSRTQ